MNANLLDSLIADLSLKAAKDRDEILREAICRKIGEDWEIADLVGRLKSFRFLGTPCCTICLDGVPILELRDPETVCEGAVMTVRQKYRYFGIEDEDDFNG